MRPVKEYLKKHLIPASKFFTLIPTSTIIGAFMVVLFTGGLVVAAYLAQRNQQATPTGATTCNGTVGNKSAGASCTVGSSCPESGGCDGDGPLGCLACPSGTVNAGAGRCAIPGSSMTSYCGGTSNGGTNPTSNPNCPTGSGRCNSSSQNASGCACQAVGHTFSTGGLCFKCSDANGDGVCGRTQIACSNNACQNAGGGCYSASNCGALGRQTVNGGNGCGGGSMICCTVTTPVATPNCTSNVGGSCATRNCCYGLQCITNSNGSKTCQTPPSSGSCTSGGSCVGSSGTCCSGSTKTANTNCGTGYSCQTNTPSGNCSADSQCTSSQYCGSGGVCKADLGIGSTCVRSAQCQSGTTCTGGKCTATCKGYGLSCATSTCCSGLTCINVAGAPTCKESNGQSCTANSQCSSNLCNNGTCGTGSSGTGCGNIGQSCTTQSGNAGTCTTNGCVQNTNPTPTPTSTPTIANNTTTGVIPVGNCYQTGTTCAVGSSPQSDTTCGSVALRCKSTTSALPSLAMDGTYCQNVSGCHCTNGNNVANGINCFGQAKSPLPIAQGSVSISGNTVCTNPAGCVCPGGIAVVNGASCSTPFQPTVPTTSQGCVAADSCWVAQTNTCVLKNTTNSGYCCFGSGAGRYGTSYPHFESGNCSGGNIPANLPAEALPQLTAGSCQGNVDLPETYTPTTVSCLGVQLTPSSCATLQTFVSECADQGEQIFVASGYRSYQEQSNMYASCQQKKQETNNPNACLVGYPGCSEHQSGNAVDLYVLRGDGQLVSINGPILDVANKLGLNRTVPGDPPHFYIGSF